MSKNHVFHSKTKHISINYHVLREKVVEKEIRLEYVNTKEKFVDIFMNPLPKDTFECLRGMLRVMPHVVNSNRLEYVMMSFMEMYHLYEVSRVCR